MARRPEDTDPRLTPDVAAALAQSELPRLVQVGSALRSEIGRVLVLDADELVLGRDDGAALVLSDQGVSRRHAAIRRTPDGFQIVDFGSRNGTFVNAVRVVDTAPLRDGDRVHLGGDTHLRFTASVSNEDWLGRALDQVATWDYSFETAQVRWSEQVDRVLRVDPGTLSNKPMPLLSVVHPDDRNQVSAALIFAANGGGPFDLELRLIPGRETLRWIRCRGHLLRNANGQPAHLSGTITDITDRKGRELELNRTALMFESLSDGVFLTDDQMRVIDLNSAAQKMFALSKVDATGQNLFLLLGLRSAAELEAAAQKQIRIGRWTADLAIQKTNRDATFEVVGFPLRNEEHVFGSAFLFRDTSERQQLQAQLAFYDRLASLGTMSAGIAHEINNPLTYVMSSVEYVMVMLSELNDPRVESHLEALGEALEGSRRIAGIVRDLKAFSRDDVSLKPTPTHSRRALESALKMCQKFISTRARLVTSLTDVPLAEATESRLAQVFINLLMNAAQAIPEGQPGAEIRVTQQLDGDAVVTSVTDTGVGMTPEVQKRIFDPFFTTKPVGTGTGLGLAICHGLVAGFGGELKVKSEVGVGSTFSVRLKVAGAPQPSPSPSFAFARSARKARILLVDDEPLILRALSRLLAAHDVTPCATVDEALQAIAQSDYDVVLCDLMMPGRTGIDLFAHVQAHHPHLTPRVAFITGGAFTEATTEFLKVVSNPILPKPIVADELSRLIQRLLDASTVAPGRRPPGPT